MRCLERVQDAAYRPQGAATAAAAVRTFIVMTRSVGSRPSATHCCSVSRLSGLRGRWGRGMSKSARHGCHAAAAICSLILAARTGSAAACPPVPSIPLHPTPLHPPVRAAVRVVEAAQRHAQPQRRLPALKAQPRAAPRPRLLPLVPAPRRLAQAGADAAAHPLGLQQGGAGEGQVGSRARGGLPSLAAAAARPVQPLPGEGPARPHSRCAWPPSCPQCC